MGLPVAVDTAAGGRRAARQLLSDTSAIKVGEGHALAHEAVDAHQEGEPGDRNVRDDRQGGRQRDKFPPVTPLAPFEVSMAMPRIVSCCPRLSGTFMA